MACSTLKRCLYEKRVMFVIRGPTSFMCISVHIWTCSHYSLIDTSPCFHSLSLSRWRHTLRNNMPEYRRIFFTVPQQYKSCMFVCQFVSLSLSPSHFISKSGFFQRDFLERNVLLAVQSLVWNENLRFVVV